MTKRAGKTLIQRLPEAVTALAKEVCASPIMLEDRLAQIKRPQ